MYPSDISNAVIHSKCSHDKTMHDEFALTVSGGATPNDTSDEVVVKGSDKVSVYALCATSTDLDVFVYVNYKKGGAYTTQPYASMNLGAGESDQLPLTPGMYGIKIKIVNNDAGNIATVTSGVNAVWR